VNFRRWRGKNKPFIRFLEQILPEIFGSASYYGIGKILRQYSNFPAFLPLPVNVQHGYVGGGVHRHDARRDAPENWFWDEYTRKSHMKAFPGIKGRTVGAPFLYLLRNINYSSLQKTEKSGTIVFPSHSSALVTVSADFGAFAQQLEQLPDDFHPITVCAYHIDLDRGVYQPFIDKGFKVVINGRSLYEKAFQDNFIDNAKDKKFAISNKICTALFFANALGLISYQLGPASVSEICDPHYLETIKKDKLEKYNATVEEYFTFPDAEYEVQKKFVLQQLGQDHMLSPEEMNKLLWSHAISIKYAVVLIKITVLSLLFRLKKFLRIPSIRFFGKSV
jgi:hypothetical protein